MFNIKDLTVKEKQKIILDALGYQVGDLVTATNGYDVEKIVEDIYSYHLEFVGIPTPFKISIYNLIDENYEKYTEESLKEKYYNLCNEFTAICKKASKTGEPVFLKDIPETTEILNEIDECKRRLEKYFGFKFKEE